MKNFELIRDEKVIAQGAIFADGLLVVRNLHTKPKGVLVWSSVDIYKEQCVRGEEIKIGRINEINY